MKKTIAGMKENFFQDRNFSLLLLAGIFIGIASGINVTIFNNYLSDTYHLTAQARGIVEFPRELPGVFIVVVIGLLAALGNVRIAAIGTLAAALGMMGLGLFSPSFGVMLIWMMLFSLGTHILLPMIPVIGMGLSQRGEYGARLGRYGAYNLSATIFGYAVVWLGFKYLHLTYQGAFVIGAIFFVLAAFAFQNMQRKKAEVKKQPKFVFRKEYRLYYILSIVNGARKQVFLTFAPWVLVQFFHVDPPVFAVLGVVVAFVSILTRTLVGRAIDYKGEKFILTVEASIVIVICLGYAFASKLFAPAVALIITAVCYVIDNSMSVVEMARSTYLRKIALSSEEVAPTLAAGTSFDHIVAMTIPFFGGLLWMKFGYEYVFFAAAAIGLLNLILAQQVVTRALQD